MSWLPAWPVFGAVGATFAAAMWRVIRDRRPLACPSCKRVPDWTGSGTKAEPNVEYRLYKCACGERLVKESHGPLQRLDDWVPGQAPQRPARARVTKEPDRDRESL